MTIEIKDRPEGLLLPVRAQPKARRNAVLGEHAGTLKVAVTAPPEDGKANVAIIEVLAKALELKKGQIKLLTGATAREKTFLISDASRELLEERLADMSSD